MSAPDWCEERARELTASACERYRPPHNGSDLIHVGKHECVGCLAAALREAEEQGRRAGTVNASTLLNRLAVGQDREADLCVKAGSDPGVCLETGKALRLVAAELRALAEGKEGR